MLDLDAILIDRVGSKLNIAMQYGAVEGNLVRLTPESIVLKCVNQQGAPFTAHLRRDLVVQIADFGMVDLFTPVLLKH